MTWTILYQYLSNKWLELQIFLESIQSMYLMQPVVVVTQNKQVHGTRRAGITAFRPSKQYPQCGYPSAKELNPREYRQDGLCFRRSVADAYYHLYRKILLSTTLFTGSRSLHHPENNLQFNGINHWFTKGSQRQCDLPGSKGTSAYYFKKCNDGLHDECFQLYHFKQSSL